MPGRSGLSDRLTPLFLALVVSIAGTARADAPRPTVLVLVEGGGDRPDAHAFSEALAARGTSRPIVADDAGVRLASEGRIAEGAIERGRDALDRGREHLRLLQFPEAEAALSEAVDLLRSVGTPDGYFFREQAEISLAVTRLEAYRRDAAIRTFVSVLVRAPDFVLDPTRYSPFVREAFEQARANVSTLPTGGLRIATRPEGLEVFLDGHSLGPSPVQKDDLVSAEHVVAVTGPGGTWSRTVAVPGGASAQTTVVFGVRAAEIARAVGADRFVILSRAASGGVRGRLGNPTDDGTVTREAASEADLATAFAPAFESRAPVGPVAPVTPPHRDGRWYESWWVYAIGVGVVGGTVATIAVLSSEGDPDPAITY
jgi:hypothetical protein